MHIEGNILQLRFQRRLTNYISIDLLDKSSRHILDSIVVRKGDQKIVDYIRRASQGNLIYFNHAYLKIKMAPEEKDKIKLSVNTVPPISDVFMTKDLETFANKLEEALS